MTQDQKDAFARRMATPIYKWDAFVDRCHRRYHRWVYDGAMRYQILDYPTWRERLANKIMMRWVRRYVDLNAFQPHRLTKPALKEENDEWWTFKI